MENKFKIGDIVKLKSGGPLMTVTGITPERVNGEIVVNYFDSGDHLHSSYWPVECLAFGSDKDFSR